ncbi:unnamed protein product [Mesocestoides corti]|uniref:Peptidase M14 domain-containing protein n=1 Tax=Mesocestoides corti TaxID=53468 RepID=A0A0R3UM10_MESCO|nr:unnamed protein product [Mesocestoides corti]
MKPTSIIPILFFICGFAFDWEEYHSNRAAKSQHDRTVGGNRLYVLTFGIPANYHKAEVKLIGNMHGNEVVGREMLLRLADYICSQYLNGDDFIVWLVKHTRIHLMPSMNPDGFDIAGNESSSGRENAHNVDLNRNFPDSDRLYFQWESEIETKMIMDWLDIIPFVLSANLHGGALVANYPFDITKRRISILLRIPNVFFHTYDNAPLDETILAVRSKKNLCILRWFSVLGLIKSMQDYNYMETNCFEITLELGCSKYPPAKDLPRYWEENRKSLLNFILQAHEGIKGFVFGYQDGEVKPLSNAIIMVMNVTSRRNPELINHPIYSSMFGAFIKS